MKTFCIQTLGCKVNQYETQQLASLLRARGWIETDQPRAELRIVNTCSVTVQAASQSRQEVRRAVGLPVLSRGIAPGQSSLTLEHPSDQRFGGTRRPRVLVSGCWATSDRAAAAALPGVDAVLTHQDDLSAELDRLLALWQLADVATPPDTASHYACISASPPGPINSDGWMKAGTAAGERTDDNRTNRAHKVNDVSAGAYANLPLIDGQQPGRQRAFLKVQDGCDAHCTYCIIPRLRPVLWSKSVDDAVEEARRLIAAGHLEIVLTGIFLGAYGQGTALRRRQAASSCSLALLVENLCNRVSGLRRLRLSSLEPGDLTDELIAVLAAHSQVVPHFHLPLQSGSDEVLRRMNRQYRRDDFRSMVDRVRRTFDRPALTTDVIVGFPGETDEDFQSTADMVREGEFIHVHAFPYSPRPGTAAARWSNQSVRGPIVKRRMEVLRRLGDEQSLAFRSQFIGQTVEVIVERDAAAAPTMRHGRCERYFQVSFEHRDAEAGDAVRLRIDRVTPTGTFGSMAESEPAQG